MPMQFGNFVVVLVMAQAVPNLPTYTPNRVNSPYLIWNFYLSVKFVMWIVKQKIENKQNLFLNKFTFTDIKTLF